MQYRRLLPAVFAAFSLLFAGNPDTPAGVRNFHIVNDHIYRGAQPTADGIRNLAKFGVRTIIDLRRGDEHSKDEETLVKQAGMHYVSVPMKGLAAPSDQQMATILGLLDDSSGWPVFIHCRRGADRTGTVIACYRIAHDHWPNEKALTEAKLDGMSPIERAMEHYIRLFKAPAPVSAKGPGALPAAP